ncbi:hypothetical protein [Methanoplanus endosymbiosus]|uniref:Uncharacterized protein n=1 Tax=Methanoplanus endosymbiosus TaxID=33865 RepID=A0A9E7PNP1_9EURY|nr:hypothetical protein [Methanoplanus endosymbiosus]UUX92076.1 hypothetical protein L6E24_12035 [Methanoplanus endosymbiosus]
MSFATKNLHGKSGTYHLAESLTGYNMASGSTLERKTDILCIIAQQVKSMLSGLDMEKESLAEVDSNIESLIEAYDPVLDSETSIPTRKDYKILQSKTYYLLFSLIRKHNLITAATLREINGDWD